MLVGSLASVTGSFKATFIGLIICSAVGAVLFALCSINHLEERNYMISQNILRSKK